MKNFVFRVKFTDFELGKASSFFGPNSESTAIVTRERECAVAFQALRVSRWPLLEEKVKMKVARSGKDQFPAGLSWLPELVRGKSVECTRDRRGCTT